MTPVTQTRMASDYGRGNCTEACLASLLDLDISAVPDLWRAEQAAPGKPWQWFVEEWLRGFGLTLVQASFTGVGYLPYFYHMMSGPGPRKVRHAVVGKGGEMIHDPHPSGLGLLKDEIISIIVPIDVATMLDHGVVND